MCQSWLQDQLILKTWVRVAVQALHSPVGMDQLYVFWRFLDWRVYFRCHCWYQRRHGEEVGVFRDSHPAQRRLQRADGARYHILRWCSSKRNPLFSSWSHAPSELDVKGNIHFQSVVVSVTIQTDKLVSRIGRILHLHLQDLSSSLGNRSFCSECPEEWFPDAAAI